MTILVTGGAGYIGSHTLIELHNAGFKTLVLDNFSNSSPIALERVQNITGQSVEFVNGDINDAVLLDTIFRENNVTAVVHFAGLKAVGESAENPLKYFKNNVQGTLTLLQAMERNGTCKFIFSSSATVYGQPEILPVTEEAEKLIANPYGRSKLMVEHMMMDLAVSNPNWQLVALRYFNPIGAHESGLIGEDPNDIPNNLVPYISQVSIGKLNKLRVFGNDYDTPDGTGVRDYIHVCDLAKGHVAALKNIKNLQGFNAMNLGCGRGYSVLEVIEAFQNASGKNIPFEFTPRRDGDVACYYADVKKARALLNWESEKTLIDMVTDTWRWQSMNPNGYN